MTLFALLAQILANLPELLKLVRQIQDNIAEAQTERRVGDDIKSIREAFAKKDAAALDRIFSGTPPPSSGGDS